jgi:pimeloyl-ACP methyl ester carboxylesterase
VPDRPSRLVTTRDGTPIAVFRSGAGPPLALIHGAAADHTTWRVTGPLLARRYTVHAIDRRGRGASGDRPPYAIEREFEDVATVADITADEAGAPVALVGHSFGGRVALGAALRSGRVAAVVCYEGAPARVERPYHAPGLVERLEMLAAEGRHEELLEAFLADVVRMSGSELAAYRASPVWPNRVAAAPTIVRELRSDASPAASLDALGRVTVPVLQVLGAESSPPFHAATAALAERLPRGRTVVIDGARHAAHHTHAERFVAEVTGFLDAVL